ncbi:MAG: methylenetetrahydrofolate--tRNA-(uracil(54)-C(5))-methyltransferase (FADH(2)-oxidizing) TrmFO [Clostridia bacterium]|nr:methylenetetrahydrofolate--tRNA-(uracil(54)-C(5))-methyltransferase (FADH(2)-oxidizing) TrmFO [Clostridia bacterium]
MRIKVVGAGLAGCEAAYQIAKRGIDVDLYEMKPAKRTPAHKSDLLCELVCSNSLRSNRLENGAGLLKEELRRLDSLIMRAADMTCVPAGGALAVDRVSFSTLVTNIIRSDKHINVIEHEVSDIVYTEDEPMIIATGPLTEGALLDSIENVMGEGLHFFDAAAPIISGESLDMDIVFEASRYERGSDYLNCPMDRDEYFNFVHELINAETAVLHGFEDKSVFEGCMPVETMAKRGEMTLAFGPLKPVGLVDERTGKRPFAVVQLRREDKEGRAYNIVGFQTNLKFHEQKRVFSLIPGLANAEFLRYGVMHRNTFLDSPRKLNPATYEALNTPGLYFAGQITGVEGYVESTASGFVAGVNAALKLLGRAEIDFTTQTALGALSHYVGEYAGHDFQPQNINFGLIDSLERKIRNKQERYRAIADRSLEKIESIGKILLN